MKKGLYAFLLITSSLLSQISRGQEISFLKIRHIAGFTGLDLSGGYAGKGVYFNAGYNKYLSDKLIFSSAFNYEYGKIGISDYANYALHFGLNNTIFKIHENLFLNIKYGGLLGIYTGENTYLEMKQSNFNYGLVAGINSEIYLLNRLALLITAEQQYNFADKFGGFHYQVGAGLRFYLK